MKMSEIENLDSHELNEKLNKLKKELMNFRIQAKTGKLERKVAIQNTRRDIARVMTQLSALRIKEKAEAKS